MRSILILLIVLIIIASIGLTGGSGIGSPSSNSSSTSTTNSNSSPTTITGVSSGSNTTNANSTVINDTTKNFTPGSLKGATIQIDSGTGAPESGIITDNTPTSITVSPGLATLPDATSHYIITIPATGNNNSSSNGGQILVPPPGSNGKQLQLDTFSMITLTPTPVAPTTVPATTCASDGLRGPNCTCSPPFNVPAVICQVGTLVSPKVVWKWGGVYTENLNETCPNNGVPCDWWAEQGPGHEYPGCTPTGCVYVESVKDGIPADPNYSSDENCPNVVDVCFAKPVIYLYSNRVINNVSVKLDIPGIVTVSNPQYPNSGWENLSVLPGGKILYQKSIYSELYYETSVSKNPIPNRGYVFSSSELKTKLDDLIMKLGLVTNERKEFLDYWLPKLSALNKPYIFVGILTPEQKSEVDNVIISPMPDSTIAFLAYFKGLAKPISIQQPQLNHPPQRKSFTMVEWGGRIDND